MGACLSSPAAQPEAGSSEKKVVASPAKGKSTSSAASPATTTENPTTGGAGEGGWGKIGAISKEGPQVRILLIGIYSVAPCEFM